MADPRAPLDRSYCGKFLHKWHGKLQVLKFNQHFLFLLSRLIWRQHCHPSNLTQPDHRCYFLEGIFPWTWILIFSVPRLIKIIFFPLLLLILPPAPQLSNPTTHFLPLTHPRPHFLPSATPSLTFPPPLLPSPPLSTYSRSHLLIYFCLPLLYFTLPPLFLFPSYHPFHFLNLKDFPTSGH